MCQYRQMGQYRRIFLRFLLQITLWASWMTSFSKLESPNLLLSTYIELRSVKNLVLRILVIKFIWTYCQSSYKIEKKTFNIWRHFECLCVFIIEQKLSFLFVECAYIYGGIFGYRRNFLSKNFRRYCSSLYVFFWDIAAIL